MSPPAFITEHNGLWLLTDDTYIRPAVIEKGRLNWDDVFAPVLDRVMKRSGGQGIVVDCGAFIGDTTEWFSEHFTCITFEPQRDAFACLVHNLPCEIHYPFPAGNGERVDLDAVGNVAGNLGGRGVRSSGRIPTIRIDDLHLENVALLKADVEGHEPFLFDGASETIARCKPIVVTEVNAAALSERGFRPSDILDSFQGWERVQIYKFNDEQYDMMLIPPP